MRRRRKPQRTQRAQRFFLFFVFFVVLSTSLQAQDLDLKAYLETGQYAEVERRAKDCLRVKRNEAQTRLVLGEVYAITGRYKEALTEFEKARETDKIAIKMQAELRRSEILELTGKREAAQEIFKTIANYYENKEPDTAEEMTLLAKTLIHLERYQEANDAYLDAIRINQEYIEAHLGGGELYTAKYNYAEAAEFFNDALKINPNSARAHLGVAINKKVIGGDEMNTALATALKINPNYLEARIFAVEI